jgi:hypothetical protein
MTLDRIATSPGAFDSKTSEMSTIVAFRENAHELFKQLEMESASCPSWRMKSGARYLPKVASSPDSPPKDQACRTVP